MKKFVSLIALTTLALTLTTPAHAGRGNKICSGKKGGISHCSGGKYVCNNGTISRTTQICGTSSSSASKFTKTKKAKSAKRK